MFGLLNFIFSQRMWMFAGKCRKLRAFKTRSSLTKNYETTTNFFKNISTQLVNHFAFKLIYGVGDIFCSYYYYNFLIFMETHVLCTSLHKVKVGLTGMPCGLKTHIFDVTFTHFFLTEKSGIAMCVGCGSQIHDQYILRVSPNLEWHAACLKCAECNQYLDETCTCFVRDGKTYCKRDYARLFGIKCAKCNMGFCSSDLVMRARDSVYHMECFRCSVCSRHLLPGDEFSLRDDELLCRADHGLLVERASSGSPLSPGNIHTRPLHISDPISVRHPPHHRNHVHKQSEKTTRVRTVLNEKQLHTLRTCYNANPRPDALMKEQLVEMTGLSPRVIRVWFQNKRCKDKKKSILMKQLQQQQHCDKTNLQGLTGTPLVAGSPIRHDNTVQGNPVEVQTYQPPWKTLSDFALQTDLDQPAFQQLVSFSESGSMGNSSGSDVTSLSSQLPDTPNSMVPSPVDT
ncbi:insulin gene enhancer protein isl-2a isoform X1 [Melanotaenia boesemani]|uniref:insulin gene enhancer protein isl-2a isoform X1 n=1 Tax=Melanotaenia boesemani TaxID=1250792 RepID=UPI001C05E42C|nr:insulin gene enhancer protein isl-2a isoform X1 [Melanotaenia boesemani]